MLALSAPLAGQQTRRAPTDPAHPALNQGPKEQATGARGMVSTQLASSTLAALQVLEGGGNAVNAAVAAAFLQQVDDYHMVFLFGSMSALYYDAATNRTYAISAVAQRPLVDQRPEAARVRRRVLTDQGGGGASRSRRSAADSTRRCS